VRVEFTCRQSPWMAEWAHAVMHAR
jgi:hypothetical protein